MLSEIRSTGGAVFSRLVDGYVTGRRWLFGVVGTLLLLGLAVVSFTQAGGVVRPITGLATFGGLFGSVSGLVAYRSIGAGMGTLEEVLETIRRLYVAEFSRSINVIGYGTFLGYCYPRIMWNIGSRVLGANGYPFGRIIWPLNGLPTAVLTTVLLLAVTVGAIRYREGSIPPLGGRRLLAFGTGYAVYGVWIFVATGFAGPLWFSLIGVSP